MFKNWFSQGKSQAMTAQQNVALSDLSLDKANVRKADRGADPVMMASIRESGIIVPLIVRPNGKGFLIVDGGKRFASMKELKFPADYQVPVVVKERSDDAARETSLTTNMVRVQMHPIDEFEAIAELHKGGKGLSLEAIGKRFGVDEKEVRKSLALGSLSPVIREAWRSNKISAEIARCFTIEPDQKRQETIFNKEVKGKRYVSPDQLKDKIRGDADKVRALMKFVSADTYKAAGGKTREDLFAGEDEPVRIGDVGLLERLAKQRMDAEGKKHVDAGWGWFKVVEAEYDKYDYNKVSKIAQGKRKKFGVLLWIEDDGKLKVETGFTKSSQQAASEKSSATRKKSSGKISNALKDRLERQLYDATKKALVADKYSAGLAVLLAQIVSSQIQPGSTTRTPDAIRKKMVEIRNGVTPIVMNEAIRKAFDSKDFFQNAPKPIVVAAIGEAMGAEHAKKLAKGTKAAAWKFAIANIAKSKWLPVQLRTDHYDGPK